MSTDQVVDKLVRYRRRSRSTILFACPEAPPPPCAWFCSSSRGGSSATAAPWCHSSIIRPAGCCRRDRGSGYVIAPTWAVPPDRYLPSPNNLSVAVIRPIVGFALQYSPSFLALETNLSVSMTGGSFSSL